MKKLFLYLLTFVLIVALAVTDSIPQTKTGLTSVSYTRDTSDHWIISPINY